MLTIIGITFPIYAMIGLGYVLIRQRWFTRDELTILGRYVLNIALPALVFGAVTTGDPAEVFAPTYIAAYALAAAGTMAVVWVLFTMQGHARTRRATAVLGSACCNSGYVGYPVLALALPEAAAPALAMNVLVENVLVVPASLALIQSSITDRSDGPLLPLLVKQTLRRPMVIGLLAGLAVMALGVEIPTPFSRLVEMISSSAAALALFIIGGTLVGLPFRGNLFSALQITAVKLVVHPLLAVAVLSLLLLAGLSPLAPHMQAALILSAAMPMLGTYAVFAQEAGHEGMASMALMSATAASFLTLSGLLWLLT